MTDTAQAAADAIAAELGQTNEVTVEWQTTVTTGYQHTMRAAEMAEELDITSAELFRRMAARDLTPTTDDYNKLDGLLVDLELSGTHHEHPSTDDRKVMAIRRAKDGDYPPAVAPSAVSPYDGLPVTAATLAFEALTDEQKVALARATGTAVPGSELAELLDRMRRAGGAA